MKTAAAILALGLAGWSAPSQDLSRLLGSTTLSTFTGSVRGLGGSGLEGVRVALTTFGNAVVAEVTTGAGGGFAFEDLRPGMYIVVLLRDGFTVELGRIRLLAGQILDRSFQKGVVIAGTVVDERNVPMPTAPVCLLRRGTEDGRLRYRMAASSTSDARGQFVMGVRENIAAGTFLVAAMPAGCGVISSPNLSARLARYPPAYFPDAASAGEAALQTLDAREDRKFTLRLRPGPVTRLEGKITGYVNTTVVPGHIVLEPPIDAPVSIVRTTRIANDGSFAFEALTPGEYRVILPPHRGPDPTRWAERTVTLRGEPVFRLPLFAQPTVAIAGTIDFAGHLNALYGTRIVLTVNALREGERASTAPILPSAFSVVGTDGKFGIYGLMPGTYRLAVYGAEVVGWHQKSAMAPAPNDRLTPVDAFDVPITLQPDQNVFGVAVQMTYKVTSVAGLIEDEEGRPAAGAMIAVFASDSRYWVKGSRRMVRATSGADGRFTIAGLPEGDYLAVPVRQAPNWPDPRWFESMRRLAVPLTLGDGEARQMTVRFAGAIDLPQ